MASVRVHLSPVLEFLKPYGATSGHMAGDAPAAEAERGATTGTGTGETVPGPTELYRYQHIIFNVL
jgi:hypothetical protein